MQDHNIGQQFSSFRPSEIGFFRSRDYAGQIKDIKFAPGGDSRRRVDEIKHSYHETGEIHTPLEAHDSGWPYLADGHHRYVAAAELEAEGHDVHLKVRGY